MKTKALMICAMALFSYLGANAQDPFKDLTKNDAVVTVKSPSIISFVTSFLSEPEDELRGSIAPEWDKYLNQEPLDKGVTLFVDQKNGFVRYEMDYDIAYPEDQTGLKSYVEYCYWNCADGTHKLFAENVGMTQNGEPAFAQFEGLYIYAYDNATQKLYMIDQELLGLGDDVRGEVTFALPRKGKDIEVCIIKGAEKIQKKLVWNGKGFNLSK
jgi:hypothetical protein